MIDIISKSEFESAKCEQNLNKIGSIHFMKYGIKIPIFHNFVNKKLYIDNNYYYYTVEPKNTTLRECISSIFDLIPSGVLLSNFNFTSQKIIKDIQKLNDQRIDYIYKNLGNFKIDFLYIKPF
jgi:hypothetical protein